MEKEIDKLTDHFIICGSGRVGRRVATEAWRWCVPPCGVAKAVDKRPANKGRVSQ
jgi:hypothetical protein